MMRLCAIALLFVSYYLAAFGQPAARSAPASANPEGRIRAFFDDIPAAVIDAEAWTTLERHRGCEATKLASDSLLAARGAPKLLGPGTTFGAKIEGQLAKRGWTKRLVQCSNDDPLRTVATRDTRHVPGGGRLDDPATAYYSRRSGYVVRNDRTGDIVQVSDRTDSAWRAPWD